MNRWIVPLVTTLCAVGLTHAAHAQGQGQDKRTGQSQAQAQGKDEAQGKDQAQGKDKDKGQGQNQHADHDTSNRGQVTSECNHRANDKQLKGQERKDFVEWCESRGSRYGYDDKRYSRERDCYQKAYDRNLSGEKRKAFLNGCLDESERKYEGSKTQEQKQSDGGLGEVLKRGDRKPD